MNNFKYQFLNGGVGGQTTFGHIYAIDEWHTKELGPAQVRAVIFYFGINDVTLLYEKHNPNETPNINIYQLKMLLLRNSFFYQRLKIIKDKFYSRQQNTSNNTTNNHLVWWGHGRRSQPFVDNNPSKIINPPENNDYIYYKSLIHKLLSKTRQAYPSATIIFVQQQIPVCRFLSPFEFIDRRPASNEDALNYCKALGEVYLSQDEVVMSLPKSEQPKILKMYLGQFISDEGVYDHTHTNESGSAEIARYLMDNLSL
jgi:lysophospholipase L1-like esterase